MRDDAILEEMHLHVDAGELADAGSWVYVWTRLGNRPDVVYVGTTALPPTVRAWLHLHDADPAVGRIRWRHADPASEPFDIIAFRLPHDLHRGAVRAELLAALDRAELLATDHLVADDELTGRVPADDGDRARAQALAGRVVTRLLERSAPRT